MERQHPMVMLATLLNSTIENLESVELGKHSSPDTQHGLLRLDCLALRLSRWAESVGLSGDITSRKAQEWQKLAFPGRHEIEIAKGLLDDLDSTFEGIKQNSVETAKTNKHNTAAVADVRRQQYLPQSEEDNGFDSLAPTEELHQAVWNVCRHRKSLLDRKNKRVEPWMLHEHSHFVHIINSANELVGELIRFLPNQAGPIQIRMEIERRQRRLAEAELRTLTHADERLLGFLKPVVDYEEDPMLSAAIARKTQAGARANMSPIHQTVTDNHGSIVGSVHSAGVNNTHIGRF